MEIFQLLYAVTLAEHRNFSRAAEKLYITQPSLSQQIQKLEQECGFLLFRRSSKQVTPTPEGERFLAQARDVLKCFDHLQDIIKEINRTNEESVVIGIGMASRSYVAECTTRVIERYPNVNFHLMEAWGPELVTMVREGKVDIALLDVDPDPNHPNEYVELDIAPITEEYICAVMSLQHPLAQRESIVLEELTQERLLFSSMRSGISKLVIRSLEQCGIKPKLGMDFNSSETCMSYVEKNAGISFATHVRAEQYRGKLAIVPIEPHIYRTYALVTKKGQTRSIVRMLRTAILDELMEAARKGAVLG